MNLQQQKHHFATMMVQHLIEVLESERPSMAVALKHQVAESIASKSSFDLARAEQWVCHYNKFVPGLYLKLYERVELSDFGLYGYAIASSSTVRMGLTLSQQFLSMTTTYYEETLVEASDYLTIVPGIDVYDDAVQLLSEDFAAGYWVLLTKIITGLRADMDSLVLEFSYPAPFYVEQYHALFTGCTLRFNQPKTQIKLPSNWLDEPISFERSNIDMLLSNHLIPSDEPDDYKLSEIERKVSEIVIGSHFTKSTVPDVAYEFSVTPRQLRFYLQRAGLSLREIVLRARMTVASQLLKNTELDIGTIAETLNYSEASAFVRSFKRYYAISPLQYRIQHLDPFI
ncbi:AraC family transcriptional regulator ligand-binding domain-containing protein [Vibrio parahaemolyticus]|uniref:AraC family transcriptional regulator ligand-binding domain-containing protein n=1 Tax=Vibrio mediterranei TaxID=689 RepID=UPI0040691FF5